MFKRDVGAQVGFKLWELPGMWEKFSRWDPLVRQVINFEPAAKECIEFVTADFERQTLSLKLRLPAELMFNNQPLLIENVPVWHFPKVLWQYIEWQRIHSNEEFRITPKCNSMTGCGSRDIDLPDLAHIPFFLLNVYFDRYMPFNTENLKQHRDNVFRVVQVLNENLQITGSHLTGLVSKSLKLARHIIAEFPDLAQNDRLTILMEISRIGKWCLPEFHKGLRDIYNRWISKAPKVQVYTADELIAQAVDLAKRTAWNDKVKELYPCDDVPDTHALTRLANLLNSQPFPIQLPADLNLHVNREDPYEVEEVSHLVNSEYLKSEFNFRVLQRLVPLLIQVYENISCSTDDGDQKMLVSLVHDLREILMRYAPKRLTSHIVELEDKYNRQTEKITAELLRVGDLLEEEKERCAVILCERDELKRALEVLQSPQKAQLLQQLSGDIASEKGYLDAFQNELETLRSLQNKQEELFAMLLEHTREKEERIGREKALLLASYGWEIDDMDQQELADEELTRLSTKNVFPPFTLHVKAAIALLLCRGIIGSPADVDEYLRGLVEFQG